MATIEILEQDRLDAENILEQILKDKVEGDYAKGTALHDLTITAFSNIFAYLRQEADTTRKRQSLLLLAEDEGDDVDDMVDEILSNFFLTRKTGRESRGVITIYFNQLPATGASIVIPPNVLFYRTSTLTFKPDTDTALSYSASSMSRVTTSTGVSGLYAPVVEYALRIPVIASSSGANYDIDPGTFISWQLRHPYITRVENTSKFSGGSDKETTTEMLARAPTAISVRDLNSARSIDAVLREEFSEVDNLFVAGMGDPEMMRDLITEEATNLWIHAGGYTDIYLNNPLAQAQEYTAVIGSAFTDPRPGYYVLRDATLTSFLTPNGDLTAKVEQGFITTVYNNLASEPNQYIIREVTDYGVIVSSRTPLPRALPTSEASFNADASVGIISTGATNRLKSAGAHAFTSADINKYIYLNSTNVANHGTYRITDVNTTSNYAVLVEATGVIPIFVDETTKNWELLTAVVDYSIGKVSDDDILPRRYSGRFTKDIQRSGFVMLPATPLYRISDVYIVDGADELSVGGRVTFLNRTNKDTVLSPGSDPSLLGYRLWIRNPSEAHSGWQVAELQVGWNDPLGTINMARFDGKTLHVVYDTLTGFDAIWAYTLDRNRRTSCASVIPKGLHPVYASMTIQYKHAATAVAALDEEVAALALADYITNYETLLTLDTSDVVAFLRNTYDVIGYIAPLTINYDLYSPDGRVIHYQTTDEVIIDKSKYHPSYLGDPYSKLDDPLVYGVTSRTLRLVSAELLLTFEVVG